MSRAFMPLYVGDYLADTQHLTTVQHGAYLLLIMHYWQHGGLPPDEQKIRKISHLTKHSWQANREAIASMFRPGWRHKRIDQELERAQRISIQRAMAGAVGGRKNFRRR